MSVYQVLVMIMQSARMLLKVSLVIVAKATLETDSTVKVILI